LNQTINPKNASGIL